MIINVIYNLKVYSPHYYFTMDGRKAKCQAIAACSINIAMNYRSQHYIYGYSWT